ncbi:MAG TPA: glucoamylase family protein [Roseiflexaceae bacterium]|nr:glucoamylase family protein [Roseiflexaceae bacterium]
MIYTALSALARGVRAVAARERRMPSLSSPQPVRPLRGELLSITQLEAHARAIAVHHAAAPDWRRGDPLRAALDRNEQHLLAAYRTLGEDTRGRVPISPAAEWLLDNYHVIADQIREIRQDLPRGYYRELPKLLHGPLAGLPRVYAIALELIEHSDGRVDEEALLRFLIAYQSVAPLSMGELWAVPIMLRVGLVENLSRLATLMLEARQLRREADTWVERLLAHQGSEDPLQHPVLRELTSRYTQLPLPLTAHLLRRLRSHEGEHDIGAIVTWLETQPIVPYSTVEELIHAEHQRQAANQVSVGNTVTSMRTLSTLDWADWFERVSLVEQVLRLDPAGIYPRCTFATRDRYRHVVETLARRSHLSEQDVARRLVARANEQPEGDRRRHIGYYLVDAGRAEFEAALGYRASPPEVLQRALLAHPTALYLGALAGVTGGLVAAGLRLARGDAPLSRGTTALAAGLLLAPASAAAKELVDRAVTRLVPPRTLPRLDLRDGIPPELRTIVVVPTLLLTPDSIRRQLEALEVTALANADAQLHFALLTDFADAPQQHMPEDDALLQIAVERVQALNERYGGDRFLLLHRRRVWNERQGCWMGWERKRGKLEEFNRLLAGATDTTFSVAVGDLDVLPQVRYVITLDADTQLPRDVGQALIGTLAHPLNQAVIDGRTRRVVAGYGVLQPRVGIDLPSATRSRFARIFAGNVGIDPYTTAVSDVYMDLFGAGIFAGKGIYDPAAMRVALRGRFPENTLLSHDLIEGCYARAALLSDVEVLDSYPTTYAAWAARQHRWVRGDWQIARWLLPRVPRASGGSAPNILPAIARFQIFDNLRRSLTPPATVAMLAASWLWLPGRPLAWTAAGLLYLALPPLFDLADMAGAALRAPTNIGALRAHARTLQLSVLRMALNVALLPDQAALNTAAIGRTLWRLLVTRRNLLEWETAAEAQRRLQQSHVPLLRRTLPALALGVTLATTRTRRLVELWPAAPVVADWLAAPALAVWLDQPYIPPQPPLAADDVRFLRRLSRLTWAYFEQFVREKAHYLAPDNFQETPRPAIADRTSPTNIGLQLLADLAAYDLGYIGVLELTARTERVFRTIERMEHFRGHLLNWYDTLTLHPLPPPYVSTVDSGNLAGALIALRQGYLALADRPLLGPHVIDGLRDTLELLGEQVTAEHAARQRVDALADRLGCAPQTIGDYRDLLRDIASQAASIDGAGPAGEWAARLAHQARSLLDDIEVLVPATALDRPPPTLRALLAASTAGDSAGAPHPGATPRPAAGDDDPGDGDLSVTNGRQPALVVAADTVAELLQRQQDIAATCAAWVDAMDFTFLYDERRRIFAIGYSLAEGRRDNSYYDLLASEARLASYLAIAKGDVPLEHWFHLGRALTAVDLSTALVSWSGTMFEYLMPLLLMPRFPETMLDATYEAVVERQIAYGREHHVPWGVSESAFNARDLQMNYQYRAFGVPGLGLKTGLGEDLVITPYASALALHVRPAEALANLKALAADGMCGAYGLYEAVDYTAERLPPGAKRAIVHSFMVHHQGMSLVSFANLLCNNVMQRRFCAEPMVQAAETLLQERVAHSEPIEATREAAAEPVVALTAAPVARQFTTPHTAVPYTHLLSNGRYSVFLTNAGGGGSFFDDLAVTRWRPDTTCDAWGSFVYVRDVRSGAVWSTTYQPTRHEPHDYQVTYRLDKAEFRQQAAGIDTRMEVAVSPEENAELRRVTLVNTTGAPRELEVTSYAEVVLAHPAADEAHPAFSNLFVETEFVPEHHALLATRRPRAASARRLWAVHVVAVRGHTFGAVQYETDRLAFVGRGRTLADPQALHGPLAQRTGAVLDPVLCLRQRVRIAPGATAQISFITGVAASREEALALAATYHDPAAAARTLDLAWTQSQVELRDLNIDADQAHRFQRLASAALYPDGHRRAKPETIARNTKGQPGLWAYGISGDYPIVLVRVGAGDELLLVAELLRAHEYWRLKRLMVDLVILNEEAGGYTQDRQEQILHLVRSGRGSSLLNQRGGIFVLRGDTMPEEDHTLLETVARAILTTRRGDLGQHLRRREADIRPHPAPPPAPGEPDVPLAPLDLILRTPCGGFTPDGREFVIDVTPGATPPAPWVNVVANEEAGFIVSESGGGYTWAANSRENRLTPWTNDPVRDPPGEALYLRDEAGGAFWRPTPHPAGESHARVRHGFGYTVFERRRGAIESTLTLFVPPEGPLKIFRLRLRNHGTAPRRLSATLYIEWVLGVFRHHMAPYVVTEVDEATGALLARNAYNVEFGGRVAFLACSEQDVTLTGDREEFIGRNGDVGNPAAMYRARLSGRTGAALDPCGALRCMIALAPGEEREVVFLLGQGGDAAEARALIARYRDPAAVAEALEAVTARWRALLCAVQVCTPDAALDVLLNGWLLYQTLVCRVWARSAFYQSGGAYGFRDQLQDVMALVHAAPEIARAHILRAASRQFVEGDVQHWWHPPSGHGIRTNFSDDYLWLPFVAQHYVATTGDRTILDECVPYLEGRPLEPGEAEYYDLPAVSPACGALYEHCARAIDYGLGRMGPHGLPLMGAGDWNDGMNLVGHAGRGESVWVGWFLISVLAPFAALAEERGDMARAARYRAEAKRLWQAIEEHAWDGAWYLRAFHDDGTPLGSATSDECRLDSLTQSWAVISGAGDRERARRGMEAVDAYLVDRATGLIRLFTPPFDHTDHDPGYIKGYLPGVRENGGQYTHAAIWVIWAWTLLGEGGRAGELLRLINPVRHALAAPERYIVEPYTVAADVYTAAGHEGRGGWTWYTGSAGWLYRLGLEQVLGVRRAGDTLIVAPCAPPDWPAYEVVYRYGASTYRIRVERAPDEHDGAASITLDGEPLTDGRIQLQDDGAEHEVWVRLRLSR